MSHTLESVERADPHDVSVIRVHRIIEGLVAGLNTPLDSIGVRNMVGVESEDVRLAIKLLCAYQRLRLP